MQEPRPIRVMLLCPGLEHARRGFESFARDCFTAFRDDPEIEMTLVKGSGAAAPGEHALGTPTRDARSVRTLARLIGCRPFRVEFVVFALRVAARIRRERPDVVYFSEWDVGRVLAGLQRRSHSRVPLVLCNGTFAVEGFGHLDRVQELTPPGLATVLERGADPERHVLLPLGFDLDIEFAPVTPEERTALRQRLELPTDRRIVISVAALNVSHKRLDHLIEEVARLPEPRPYLVLAGQEEPETPRIRALARARLGDCGHSIRTLTQPEVTDHLRAADQFVLASLHEGLPRALVEALAQGLPCLTHDYPVTRYTLGEHGYYGDFVRPGGLAELLGDERARAHDSERQRLRNAHARSSFGWDGLRPRYHALFRSAAGRA
jgi:glycosyltransferase involved in cell wall biosynthesis